jgi:hypothetical protein
VRQRTSYLASPTAGGHDCQEAGASADVQNNWVSPVVFSELGNGGRDHFIVLDIAVLVLQHGHVPFLGTQMRRNRVKPFLLMEI